MLEFFGPYNAFGWQFGANAGALKCQNTDKNQQTTMVFLFRHFREKEASRRSKGPQRSRHDPKWIQNHTQKAPKAPKGMPNDAQRFPEDSPEDPKGPQSPHNETQSLSKWALRLFKAPVKRSRSPGASKIIETGVSQGSQNGLRSAIHGSLSAEASGLEACRCPSTSNLAN